MAAEVDDFVVVPLFDSELPEAAPDDPADELLDSELDDALLEDSDLAVPLLDADSLEPEPDRESVR